MKHISSFLFLFALLFNQHIFSNPIRTFSSFASNSIAHWVAFAPLITHAYTTGSIMLSKNNEFESWLTPTPEAQEFVETQLKYHGFNPKDFDIKVGKCYSALIYNGKKTITITTDKPGQNLSILDLVLASLKNAKTPEEIDAANKLLNVHIAIIDHEITHLKNNDQLKRILASLAIPAAYFAIKAIQYYKSPKVPSAEHSFLNDAGTIVKGMIFSLLNQNILWYVRRIIEQKADNGIRNDPIVLKAFRDLQLTAHKNQEQQIKEKRGESAAHLFATNTLLNKYYAYQMEPDHPSCLERHNKIVERLEKLGVSQ